MRLGTPMLRRLTALATALLLALSMTGCGGGDDDDSGGVASDRQAAGNEEGDSASTSVAGGEDESAGDDAEGLTVTAKDFEFDPSSLEVPAGEATSIRLVNAGDAPHTFTIDGQDVDESLEPGSDDGEAKVTVPAGGRVVFYCRFHRGRGMEGTITARA